MSEAAQETNTENTQTNVTTNEELGVDKASTEETSTSTDDSSSTEELILGKFKDTDELTSGYTELEKQYGKLKREKAPEAPESYEITFSEMEEFAEYKDFLTPDALKDNPHLDAIMPALKKHDVTQEAFNDIVGAYFKVDVASLGDAKSQFQSLGDEGGQMLTEVQRWISKFPEAEQEQFSGLGLAVDGIMPGFTADNLKLAHKIMSMSGDKSIPDKAVETVKVSHTELLNKAAELKRNTPNFELNTQVQAEYEKLMTRAAEIELKQSS